MIYFHQFRRCVVLLLMILFSQSNVISIRADEGTDDYNLAISLFNQSRWKQAAEQFRKFLTTHEKHEKAAIGRLYLGLTLGKLEEYKESAEDERLLAVLLIPARK